MSVKPTSQLGPTLSLLDVVRETPRVMEVLPPEARKTLSATCRSLRTGFCTQVKVISLADSADASKLCCATWPQLMMVVYASGLQLSFQLSAQWEFMMGMVLGGPSFTNLQQYTNTVLVTPRQQLCSALVDLPRQYRNLLLDFADKHRHRAKRMILNGPCVGCSVIRSLAMDPWPSLKGLKVSAAPQLEMECMSHLSASLSALTELTILDTSLDASAISKMGTGFAQLQFIRLSNNQLDDNLCLDTGQMPCLSHLLLESNTLGVSGKKQLMSCPWSGCPVLTACFGWPHACVFSDATDMLV